MLASSKPDIIQGFADTLQDFTSKTLTFRNDAKGDIQKCEILKNLHNHAERAVYKCLWRGENVVLKWWDENDEFCQWRRELDGNPYIPSIYAYGKVVQGPLKPGFVIIVEWKDGEIFCPRLWHFMEEAERTIFKRILHDAFHSFREKNVVHEDPQFNILWDKTSQRLTVIDWEDMIVRTDVPPPEYFEILLVLGEHSDGAREILSKCEAASCD
ncbi:hypothetical protein AA313_de0206165 [Arthrobotrys entomopaga]|nr:hypothetical protein AA313_de0206165 [Arthrobotrys entomopaga]